MSRQVLVVHPELTGENHGIHHQHVTAVQWLLDGSPEWTFAALDAHDPSLGDAALNADLLVLQMLRSAEAESIIALRRRLGRPTIFEIYDNIVAVGEWLAHEHGLRSPMIRQGILNGAAMCDALHVYSPRQLELFGSVNANTSVVDYYIPLPKERPAKDAGFVFGWAGSTTHHEDLARIAPAITEFCQRHSDAVFAYMGHQPMFAQLFGEIPESQVRRRPYSPHPEYLAFARTWHAGLGPLRDTPFNRLRSDAKFIEYTSCGVASVLERATTFAEHAEHAMMFSNPEEFLEALEALYRSRDLLHETADRAFQWVRTHRSKSVLLQQRLSLYSEVLPPGSKPSGAALPRPDPAAARRFSVAREAALKKRHAESLGICAELLAVHPRFAQAQSLTIANLHALGREADARAFSQAPDITPVCLEATAALRGVDGDGSAEVPRLRARIGRGEDPFPVFRELLRHRPYEYFALAAVLRRLFAEDPQSEEVAELFLRASLVYPEGVPEEKRPRHLAPYLPPCTAPIIPIARTD